MNVTLRQLRVFLAVARQGSFSKAADEVALSQPATSLCVHELEDALGAKLFDRTTRQVRLTAIGETLRDVASRIVMELDSSLRDIQSASAQKRGLVSLSVAPSIVATLMPAVLAECARRYEHLRLRIFDDAARDVRRKVDSGDADFGIASGPWEGSGLATAPLLDDPFCLVTRADHKLSRRRAIAWKELDGERLVMLDNTSGSRRLISDAIQGAGISVTIELELAQPSSVSAMVASGLGVSVMPRLACFECASLDLRVIPLSEPALNRSIQLLRRDDRSLSPAAQAVWSLIQGMYAPGTQQPRKTSRSSKKRNKS